MKIIKAKSSKAPEKVKSLIHPPSPADCVDRVLVVYGEQDASIYYEPPAQKPAGNRPS